MPLLLLVWPSRPTSQCRRTGPASLVSFVVFSRLDGSVETTNEILDSASHDCPLVTQTYSTAVAKGTHMPASPTRLGKGCDTNLEGKFCQHLPPRLMLSAFRPYQNCRPAASCCRAVTAQTGAGRCVLAIQGLSGPNSFSSSLMAKAALGARKFCSGLLLLS